MAFERRGAVRRFPVTVEREEPRSGVPPCRANARGRAESTEPARALNRADLRDAFAVAVTASGVEKLPLPPG